MTLTVGSICSGIEAASVAWDKLDFKFEWFSEIAQYPSSILSKRYPHIPNYGDMKTIPEKIINEIIPAPDLICGGTPCQAFSLAGWQRGLNDERGNLALTFVELIEACDTVRLSNGKSRSIILWENVEGILSDKTNAFGCFISALAGIDHVANIKKWSGAGFLHGKKRDVVWRVLDSKYFGLPQQRKRLYVIAGSHEIGVEKILFEKHIPNVPKYPDGPYEFEKDGHHFMAFRSYTDCLYSSYGTKWNGNAAAYNGSLFIVQDDKIRRFSPLECERLMGFNDNYTLIEKGKKTNRYQAIGNSWAVPVIRWIGKRILSGGEQDIDLSTARYFNKSELIININSYINVSPIPERAICGSLKNIVNINAPSDIYLSPVGCYGIIRRKRERKLNINPYLENVLLNISSKMPLLEIEKISLVQHRGKYSNFSSKQYPDKTYLNNFQKSLLDI